MIVICIPKPSVIDASQTESSKLDLVIAVIFHLQLLDNAGNWMFACYEGDA